ncbi:MAG: radical SAM protein [Elusimicrobia bacterium]|nr:radical SAM protein [Elusimicrobiota bacterium]MBD3411631.1 radical SAM protein [Elusimicrobiota bacterium]
MNITAYHNILNVTDTAERSFAFDASGRLFAVYDNGWYIRRSINGSMAAKRWTDLKARAYVLQPDDSQTLNEQAYACVRRLQHTGLSQCTVKYHDRYAYGQVHEWIAQTAQFDCRHDSHTFSRIYRAPVGILPPDHYLPVVVQVTEGCQWNQCSFCTFYKNQRFRKKSLPEIMEHIKHIRDAFGTGISLRNSVFLGEANCLALDTDAVVEVLHAANELFEPVMDDYRGISAFVEPHAAHAQYDAVDFQRLKQAGLRCVYVGFETGSEELRHRLHKPGTVRSAEEMIRRIKEAAMSVGLILMVGIGGHRYEEIHVNETIEALRRLPLDGSDMIFMSPLLGGDGIDATGGSLHWHEIVAQYEILKQGLPFGLRSSLYEIQGFIY